MRQLLMSKFIVSSRSKSLFYYFGSNQTGAIDYFESTRPILQLILIAKSHLFRVDTYHSTFTLNENIGTSLFFCMFILC